MVSFLSREKTVAGLGYSRWLFPPVALAVHMCIGQAYGLSVFNIPLSKLIGITQPAPDDWPLTATVQVFNRVGGPIRVFLSGRIGGPVRQVGRAKRTA